MIDLKVTVYEDVCSCVPFAVATLYMYRESVRDAFYTFAIRVSDSRWRLLLMFAIHVGYSHW